MDAFSGLKTRCQRFTDDSCLAGVSVIQRETQAAIEEARREEDTTVDAGDDV